jgi:hypothetical protein
MITAHLLGELLPSGEAFCTLYLEEALPTDEVLLHIWQPRPTASHVISFIDPYEAEKEDYPYDAITIAYDEQRQQHLWRGTVPGGRRLMIVVERRGGGIGIASLEFDGARFTWFQELQLGIPIWVNQSFGEANPTPPDDAQPTAHEAIGNAVCRCRAGDCF